MTIRQYWLALRKYIYLLMNKRYIVKKVKNTYFLLDILNYIDRQIEAFNGYETAQVDFFVEQIEKYRCDYFLDIGAHWGYYSLLIANNSKFANIEILSFEPDPVNRDQFFANIFLNRLEHKIKIFDYALSDQEGVLKFDSYNDENRGRSHISLEGELSIKTKKLDVQMNVKDKNLAVKIDVEGHEINVIDGMTHLLQKNVCLLQIESFGENQNDLHNKLINLEYRLINQIGNDHYYTNNKKV